ncbi:hypothetical protein DL96DRAFT_1582764 [Flagelloscypha sp. PMI_526]|nr:hypothetical protein DL96DRAFT_1582764 [Flagelloscypha sp. PMI_526]
MSYTILIWDHIITFSDEVEHIWLSSNKKCLATYLFLFNRYVTPIAFIINLYAYFSTNWTLQRCDHFVRYEGAMHAIEIYVVAYMMLLRVKALYHQASPVCIWIPRCLRGLLVLEIGVTAFLLFHGQAVIHNPSSGVEACTMIFDKKLNVAASSSFAWMPLFYDTIVLGLTLYRTLPQVKGRGTGSIVARLLHDGILYFCVIFALALSLTLMIILAPPGVKNIMGQAEQLITVAMMSRITLSLKKAGMRPCELEMGSTGAIRIVQCPESTFAEDNVTLEWVAGPSCVTDAYSVDEETVPDGQKIIRLRWEET